MKFKILIPRNCYALLLDSNFFKKPNVSTYLIIFSSRLSKKNPTNLSIALYYKKCIFLMISRNLPKILEVTLKPT